MFNKTSQKTLSLLVILLIPKVHASQASSTSSCSSSSTRSQMSFTALKSSLLASAPKATLSNKDHRDPAPAQARQRSSLQKIEETIRQGELLWRKGKLEFATTFMQHAYAHSAKFPAQHAITAGNLGTILMDQNKHAQALLYLEEAYACIKNSPSNNPMRTILAYDLGRIYLLNQGVEPDYAKAFAFLSEAQKSICTDISAPANNYIGLIYLNGFGKQQDLLKARDYFLKALKGVPTGAHSEVALNNLLTTLTLQIAQIKFFYMSIIFQLQPCFPKKNARLFKQARTYIQEIKTTQKNLPFYLTAFISKAIANVEEELKQIQMQSKQAQQQSINDQESTAQTTNTATQECSKTVKVQTTEVTMQSMLKEAVERYEAFLKKPTDGRYQEAVYILREMLPLTISNTEAKTEIIHMLDRIARVYQQQQTTPSVTATSNTQTKKEINQTQKWSLLDPFHQITSSTPCAVQQRLNLLQEDYLDVPDVIKLHGFINLWRTRVGTIRILYTVLPKAHAIGIIQIDDRKDVYENVEELQHREAWFYEPNLEARLKERAEQKA